MVLVRLALPVADRLVRHAAVEERSLSEAAAHGDPIALGEKQVGTVGSACVSPALGPIALALVRREAEPGDEVTVAGHAATVIGLPFAKA